MAGVNRFYRRAPYDIGLYVPPVDVLRESLANAQKQFDTNYALSDQIKNNYINSLPQDRQRANEIQQQWASQVDDIVSTYQGDYSKIGRKLAGLMSNIRKELNPGGEANAIISNFGNYSKWLTEHQERVAKGNILGEDVNLANNYYMSNYKGIGQIDPVTGAYNRFNPETLTDYADPNKIIQDVYKEFKPEKYKVGESYLDNGFIRYKETEKEGITPERLNPSFQTALVADPKFMAYIQQKYKFMGKKDQVAPSIAAYAGQRAQDLSYMHESSINKMERDPLAVAREKARLDKQNIDYMMSFQQYGETTEGLLKMEPTIDPENWRNDITASGVEYTGQTPFGGAPLIGTAPPGIATPKESLASFLTGKNDEKILAKWSVSPDLMRAHWEQKKSWTPEFTAKYGKDPVWTKEFEKNFMYDIKKIAPAHSSYQIVEDEIPEPARDQTLQRALRAAISNKWPVFKPGSKVSTSGIPDEIKDLIYDEKEGKFKNLNTVDITYVRPGPGIKAAGYKISTEKGSIIIQDQNASRKAYSDNAAAAFNPIYFDGRKMGGADMTYAVAPDGTLFKGKPYRKFEWNPSRQNYDDNLYIVEPWSKEDNPEYIYEDTPFGRQPVKRTAAQLNQLELPAYAGSLGYGSSKAEQTPHPFFMFGQ